MNKEIITKDNIKQFTDQCFYKDRDKAAEIVKGILEAHSPRISDISNKMSGNPDANYKTVQRFIEDNDPKEALKSLYDKESPYVLGDPTDIERPQAKKTEYVGKLKNKKPGFQIMVLSTPHRGRAIPFGFITYSSKTIDTQLSSRNMEHGRAIGELKELLGDKILVLDREFSYQFMLEEMVYAGIRFVIRLNTGNKVNILNESGDKVCLRVGIGEEVYYRGVYYKGNIKVNIAGKWEKGFSEPIWVMTSEAPEKGMEIYSLRMKIEESFRDMKNLLNMEKIMNKKQVNMEKMIALLLIAYSIGFIIGEQIRDRVYPGNKWKLYSGLFILLKRKFQLAKEVLIQVIDCAYAFFKGLIFGFVRTNV